MRRGHPGIGNWRNENPRHFRPRGSGTPHVRPSMTFGSLESNRFPVPLQRYRGPRPYNADDLGPSDRARPYRGHHTNQERQILPLLQMRLQKNNQGAAFNKSSIFEISNSNTNSMGDVDYRSRDVDLRQQTYEPNQISPWASSPFERRNFHIDKSPHKTPKHHTMGDSSLPLADYTGHRPPSSDHYSGTSGPNNNNNPYSRSVDDTVDIVRKRLMNRDSQDHSDPCIDQREMDIDMRINSDENYHDIPQEQPVKKRIQRQIRSNCDKMKNKIVHQLFKMDKGKIHKLMDNPNSSSKFEYAISSLITESQNSFNRHMRSVAEKSLSSTSSSSDFIHDDNNTIYEDTFMRQMQGILDPQDTVLLEDIKPLVLAELSKVLCLDDFDRCEGIDNHARYQRDEYNNEPVAEYPHNAFYEHVPETNHDTEVITGDLYDNNKYDQQPSFEEPALFERRPPKQLVIQGDRSRSRSTESWQPRKSIDTNSIYNRSNEEISRESEEPRPLFDGNCDQLSEDDDTFADLDNQYHVAVDHNFIEQDDEEIVSPIPDLMNHRATSPHTNDHTTHLAKSPTAGASNNITLSLAIPDAQSNNIIKEIDSQLQTIAQSPLHLLVNQSKENANAISKIFTVKQEIDQNVSAITESLEQKIVSDNVKVKQEAAPAKEAYSEPVKHAADSVKRKSRKRSVDTKPTHRKEKRKKSSHSECHETATSIFNMFYDSKPSEKDSKTVDNKGYSDKYVKRKESLKKSKDKTPDAPKSDTQKKQNSNTIHSIPSPKDTSSSSVGDQTPSKLDKVKLTAIDIFSGGHKPKKGNVQQASTTLQRKNSSTTPLAAVLGEDKIKPVVPTVPSFARRLTRRHMGTQVIIRIKNKECQTVAHRISTIGTQTDPVKFQKNQYMSAEPLERMKEIDMEIQMLLQEKFKLYNSIETKNKETIGGSSTMGTLGMAVLNVPIETDESDSLADSIAEDFTRLPVEELEQIAMESLDVRKSLSPAVDKRSRRKKVMESSRKKSESPTTRKKKSKPPNISLLEQIISDDRPIEEIISLDDLEMTPARSKKKPYSRSKKKLARQNTSKPFVFDPKLYDLKECSVVLQRLDVNTLNNHDHDTIEPTSTTLSPIPQINLVYYPERPCPVPIQPSIVEEPVNDIQIDMMEVCEDIVIEDEVKIVSDVEERVPISEDIILDNSQSSAEYPLSEITEGECKMYDYSTDDILKRDAVTVTGNADAVLAIECINNSFIAACLDGNVYHFTTDGQLVNTLRGSNLAVTCLTIVKEKYGTTIYTGSLDSRIRYYDLDTGLEKGPECNVLSPIQTMDRAWDTVFVGTRTGFVLQFECKNNMLIPVSTVKFSEQSILALRAMKEGPRKVLLVAARSDNVTIKDAQTGLLLRTLEGPKMTVYSLLFEDGKVYCGTSSHQIHVFDYASGAHAHAHAGGKGAVCLRAAGGLLFAGCYDGCVYVYREGEPRPLAQLRGPALMLLALAIRGTKIIAGYKDRSLYIWKIPLAVLQEMIL